nr:coat protein [Allamanda chlorotic virus A]
MAVNEFKTLYNGIQSIAWKSTFTATESKTLQEFYVKAKPILDKITSISEDDKKYFTTAVVLPSTVPPDFNESLTRVLNLQTVETQSNASGPAATTSTDTEKQTPSDNKRHSVRPPYGTNSVLDINSLFDVDPYNNVFVLPPDTEFSVTEATPPGVFSKQQLKLLTPSITNLCEEVWQTVDSKHMGATMVGIGQILAMAMTSMSTKSDDVEPAVIKLDGKEGIFTYGRVRTTLTQPFTGSSVQNAMRRFVRAISPSMIHWMNSGMIKPNIKLMSKWGVPPAFYPYTIDGVIPDAGRDGLSAVLAKMLSTMIAIKQAQNLSTKVLHNALEQSSGGLGLIDKLG